MDHEIFAAASKWFHLLFFLFSLSQSHVADSQTRNADLVCQICGKQPFAAGSVYEANVKRSLSSITSRGDAASIHTNTIGEGPDRVYVLSGCKGSISSGDCRSCLRKAVQDVVQRCLNRKTAVIRYSYCLVHYGEGNFFSSNSFNSFDSGNSDSTSCYLNENQVTSPHAPTVGGDSGDTPVPDHSGERRKPLTIVISMVVTTAILVTVSGFLYFFYCIPKKRSKSDKPHNSRPMYRYLGAPISTGFSLEDTNDEASEDNSDLPLINLETILVATDNFSSDNKLGEGGFGPVYKGILPDSGKEVAIKRLSARSGQGQHEFMNEVLLTAKLQHKNLVRLLYCCMEKDEMLLIYEYMPNKSLDAFIFDPTKRAKLDWDRRLDIIGGIARGLLYLHEDSRLTVIHRDLKASNVLLDKKMNPKISDFGMARIFGGNQIQANTNRIVGTYGYMSPEYAMGGLFSAKSDVFSFGVLLLEILSGRKNTGFYLLDHAPSLIQYVWHLWCTGRELELLDPLVMQQFSTSKISRCIHIGLLCVQEDAADRPTMSSVIVMLASEAVVLPPPKKPAFSMGRDAIESAKILDFLCTNNLTMSQPGPR